MCGTSNSRKTWIHRRRKWTYALKPAVHQGARAESAGPGAPRGGMAADRSAHAQRRAWRPGEQHVHAVAFDLAQHAALQFSHRLVGDDVPYSTVAACRRATYGRGQACRRR